MFPEYSVQYNAGYRCVYVHHIKSRFYCAMHFSAERGLGIACHLSVRLSVCNVDGLSSHRLEILEANCTTN